MQELATKHSVEMAVADKVAGVEAPPPPTCVEKAAGMLMPDPFGGTRVEKYLLALARCFANLSLARIRSVCPWGASETRCRGSEEPDEEAGH